MGAELLVTTATASAAAAAGGAGHHHGRRRPTKTNTTTTTIPRLPQPAHSRLFARLASNLLKSGRLDDLLMVSLRGREARSVVAGESEKVGTAPGLVFDGEAAMGMIAAECRRIARGGLVEELIEVMEVLAGYGFDIKEFMEPLEIIKLCVKKREPELAVRYVNSIPNTHSLFCSIIHDFGKKKDLVSALAAFDACILRLDGPNMYVYRAIIDVCGICGDFLKSRYIYEDMLSKKIIPNTYVFNSLMNVNAHDMSYTWYIYKQMQTLGVAADMTSYNILLKACCHAAQVDLAQGIYKEIKHMASRGTLKLDVFTYSTILKVFADAKMWQMAWKIKEDMLSNGVTPNVVTWSSLISAFAQVGMVEQAVQVFREMLQSSCEPNSQCCNILLYACVESHQYDRAFRFFSSWKKNGFQKLLNDGVPAVADIKKDSGTKTSTATVPFRPSVATYNILMKACGTDYHRASILMDEMKVAGLSPNQITWSILINICVSSNNFDSAIQAFRTMRDSGVKPDVVAYTAVIKACIQNNNMEMAFLLYEEMKRCRIQPNLVTYNTLLRARRKYGSLVEVQQCMAIYLDMRKAGYNSDDYFLKELIEEWCEGVIGNNEQNIVSRESGRIAEQDKYQAPLLEKIAALLQKDIVRSPTIDLRGFSKVEARIVVLVVLRMIKENYLLGVPIDDNIVIMLGIRRSKINTASAISYAEVPETIINMLSDELGIEVLDERMSGITCTESDHTFTKENLNADFGTTPRRPPDIGRLIITKNSLYDWLKKSEDRKGRTHTQLSDGRICYKDQLSTEKGDKCLHLAARGSQLEAHGGQSSSCFCPASKWVFNQRDTNTSNPQDCLGCKFDIGNLINKD